MRKILQRLFPAPPAPDERKVAALRKRRIEGVLRQAGLSRSASERVAWQIQQVLSDG